MIAERFYNFTERLGDALNNVIPSNVSDIVSGVFALWWMIISFLGITICEFIYIILLEKENKVVKDND